VADIQDIIIRIGEFQHYYFISSVTSIHLPLPHNKLHRVLIVQGVFMLDCSIFSIKYQLQNLFSLAYDIDFHRFSEESTD